MQKPREKNEAGGSGWCLESQPLARLIPEEWWSPGLRSKAGLHGEIFAKKGRNEKKETKEWRKKERRLAHKFED